SATQCTVTCGGGTEYYVESYKDAYLDATCPDVTVNTGESCNTQACCSEGTWTKGDCTFYGYREYERYNECKGEWEYETRTKACAGPDFDCYWTDCEDGVTEEICYYYYGDELQDWARDEDTCEDPDADIKGTTPSITPNGNIGTRYDDNCNSYFITTCASASNDSLCNYTQINGRSQSGTIRRGNLKTALPASCNQPTTTTKDICDYDGSELFGRYKGHITGSNGEKNYGTWYGSLSFSYQCYNGAGCYRSNGYERICVADECGIYKGWTAKQIKDAKGCDFSRFWCSCAHEGKF
ncbi:MAG: hypothetical protein IJO63_01230, partial [Bacilli bacterium]|nr:hypothetical protein [Bacilli bacterium]